jgi:uncharacterized protein with GYD domain
MPLYMIQFAYTPEAKAALARVPEDRSAVFGRLVEDMGGQMHASYRTLGDYDGVTIFEAPDEQAAHSIELAASQPGHLKETKITTLLPIEESTAAMHEASKQEYRGPRGLLGRADQWAKGHPM